MNEATQRLRMFEIVDDELAPRYRRGEHVLGDCDLIAEPNDDVVWVYPDGSHAIAIAGSPRPNMRDVLIGYVITATYTPR